MSLSSSLRRSQPLVPRVLPAAPVAFGHHFTVDVEEYFQVSALEGVAPPSRWDEYPSRVADSLFTLLDLLARHDARGTFFILGWIAERRVDLVRAIAGAGHEVASHGTDHKRVTHQTPDEFRVSVRDSKARLEDVTGHGVLGFRAPSFSIVPGREWALEILLEEGYQYDSSLFPIRRRGYGYATAPREPHWRVCANGTIAEFPPATLRLLGQNLPAGGGAYFRLFPLQLSHAAVQSFERRGIPATFYIHPWEIDPEQPRFPVSRLTRIRHYGRLRRTASRLDQLLSRFRFTRTISDSLLEL